MNEIYDLKGSWVDRHAKARGGKTRLDSDWPPYKFLQVARAVTPTLTLRCGPGRRITPYR